MEAVYLLLWLMVLQQVGADYNERRLYTDLLNDINKKSGILERPVQNNSQKVTVYLGVILQQLINMDEQNQLVKLNAWLKYTWNDYKLRWHPAEYGNIFDIRLPKELIWKPDVLLYNSVDSNFDSTYPTNMVVYNDGTTNWIPPGIFKISCKMDITWFPFDDQKCWFKFGSWTYDGTKINLQPDENGFDMSDYLDNGEWLIRKTEVIRKEKFYACCPEPYPDLKFILYLRRRTLYYGFNMLIPCIVITLMTLLGFMLPPDAGEKIGLQITVMLSICFFLSLVSTMTPPTSESVPLLEPIQKLNFKSKIFLAGTFFSCCMILVAVSVVFTVLVLNLHHRTVDTYEMNKFTEVLLLHWLPWLLCMKRPGHHITRRDLPELIPVTKSKEGKFMENGYIDSKNDRLDKRINGCFKLFSTLENEWNSEGTATLVLLQRIYAETIFVTKRMSDEDDEKKQTSDWQFAAMVVDRMCLVVFTFLISISTLFILFSAPYLTEQ